MRSAPKVVPQPLSWTPPEYLSLRGGSWLRPSGDLRAARRLGYHPWHGVVSFGSRVVLEVK